MNRVRYAENGNEDEVRYFIDIKGLKLGKYPQLELQKRIEVMLDEIGEKQMTTLQQYKKAIYDIKNKIKEYDKLSEESIKELSDLLMNHKDGDLMLPRRKEFDLSKELKLILDQLGEKK